MEKARGYDSGRSLELSQDAGGSHEMAQERCTVSAKLPGEQSHRQFVRIADQDQFGFRIAGALQLPVQLKVRLGARHQRLVAAFVHGAISIGARPRAA